MTMGRREFFRRIALLPAAVVSAAGDKGERATVLSCKAKMATVKAERITIDKICMITGDHDRVVMSGVSVPVGAEDPVLTAESLRIAAGHCVKIGKTQ